MMTVFYILQAVFMICETFYKRTMWYNSYLNSNCTVADYICKYLML